MSDVLTPDLTARRINWSALTRAEIKAVRTDAVAHGDTQLARRATAALRRRVDALIRSAQDISAED